MNGDMHCAFRLPVRFLDAMSVVRWSAVEKLPQIQPVRLPMDQAQVSHAWYLPGMCRRRLLQVAPFAPLGQKHSLDSVNLSGALGIEAPTRSRPSARLEKQRTAIAQTVCEERRAMTSLTYAA